MKTVLLNLGTDWEVINEEEKKHKVDPRLAGLAKYFDKR